MIRKEISRTEKPLTTEKIGRKVNMQEKEGMKEELKNRVTGVWKGTKQAISLPARRFTNKCHMTMSGRSDNPLIIYHTYTIQESTLYWYSFFALRRRAMCRNFPYLYNDMWNICMLHYWPHQSIQAHFKAVWNHISWMTNSFTAPNEPETFWWADGYKHTNNSHTVVKVREGFCSRLKYSYDVHQSSRTREVTTVNSKVSILVEIWITKPFSHYFTVYT